MIDTVAIQDALREKAIEAIRRAGRRSHVNDFYTDAAKAADAILAIPEIEAGLALYLGSIEERETS